MRYLKSVLTGLLLLCLTMSTNAQIEGERLLVQDAWKSIEGGYFENGLNQLAYYAEVSDNDTSPTIESMYVDAWIGLDNYFEALRYVERYNKIATSEHEAYSKMQSIKQELEEEVSIIKDQLKSWAANATKAGISYDWEAHNGLLPVGIAPSFSWCGYVNKEGEVVIPFQYKVAGHFEDGFASVFNRLSGNFEIIKPDGTVHSKLDAGIGKVYPIQQGYAGIELKELGYEKRKVYGIIDMQGDRIDDQLFSGYEERYIFSDGSRYPVLKDGKFGLIDVEKGSHSIDEEKYFVSSAFHNDKLLIRPFNFHINQFDPNLLSGYAMLDTKGNEIIPMDDTYVYLESFFNDYSIGGIKGKGYGVLNKDLDVVIPFEHTLIGRTHNEDEFVIFDDGDLRGEARVYNAKLDKMLSRPVRTTSRRAEYPEITITYPSFSEPLMALVTKKGKIRYYDHDLNDVFDKDFVFGKGFSEGMAVVTDDKRKSGYINLEGTLVVPYTYDHAQLFSNGYAVIGRGASGEEKFGYIDNQGDEVIPIIYDYVEPFFDSTEIFKYYYSPKQLMFLGKGDVHVDVLDITFDTNEVFFHLLEGKKLALVKKKDKMQFIDPLGKVWLERPWSSLDIKQKTKL